MKIVPRQINTFLENPPDEIAAVLFHGNDLGLIGERAKLFANKFSCDLEDVFSVTRLNGEMLVRETGLISDSASAIPLTGTQRLVLVKGRGTELLSACKLALTNPISGAIIIVEATETTTKHAIVKLFETTKHAASIGCYADGIKDIYALAKKIFAIDNIKASTDALDIIALRLGSDHAISRREIEKLALMAGPSGTLDADSVHIALGDSANLAINDIAEALASGTVRRLQQSLQKAWYEDMNAVMIVRGCQSYFRQLGLAGYAMASGESAQNAIRCLKPPIHFKLQDRLQVHLQRWQPHLAMDVVNRLQDIEFQLKSNKIDDRVCTAQSLLGICLRSPY
ncbi:DNA polymerase III subunit delta [Candidatus Puniceispirillum sp.]|nr:DNA polymerase III subunit delta [Candidatus Puniceispirillum sp.]